MTKTSYVLIGVLILIVAVAYVVDPRVPLFLGVVTPRELAREAYYQIEANVFDRAKLQNAYTKINAAADRNPKEAFVYLAVSLGTLVAGYTIGDWYELKTFPGESVQQSFGYAKQALELDPNLGQAHAHLARLLILKKEFAEADQHLKKAKELDPTGFYPWYFEGIWHEKQGHAAEATQAFDRAQQYVALKHHPMLVLKHREEVAKISKDFALQEKLLKDGIALNPGSAYSYGSYAQFLMCQGRYREAIVQWEKALSIASYGRAIDQLAKAREYVAQPPTQTVQGQAKTGCA
jgi:hypothetical protein